MERPTLETERLVLRPFRPADAPDVRRLAGEREVAATTLRIPHPYEEGMAEEWIATLAGAFERGELVNFAVTLREGGALAGAIGLTISAEHGHAELGYWIGRPYWGLGYATEAARAVVGYGFGALDLIRVHAHHLTVNPASGAVLRKVGMRHEGRLRQHIRKWGVPHDVEAYGILRADPEAEALAAAYSAGSASLR